MIQIRRSVFETNSSSTHSICITKNMPDEIPDHISFHIGEYGWEFCTLTGQEKANYLYTAILCQPNRNELVDKLVYLLDKMGIKWEFEEPEIGKYGLLNGYVDHAGGTQEFIRAVLHNRNRLKRYLFSDQSFVQTGNDNSDESVIIHVPYPHEQYYKGN